VTGKQSLVVGVSGGSAAGKTTVAYLLAERLEGFHPALIGVDRYFLDRSGLPAKELESVNYDVPSALDFGQLELDLKSLREGGQTFLPIYDYTSHSSRPKADLVESSPLIIVEGILLFYPPDIQTTLDYRIFVEAEREERLRRRIARDVVERGRSAESVVRRFFDTVEPAYEKYTYPTRKTADFVLDWNKRDPDAIETIARRITALMV